MPARIALQVAVMSVMGLTPLAAQTPSTPTLPRVELGGIFSVAAPLPAEAVDLRPAVGLIVGVPLTDRHALDVTTQLVQANASDLTGLYHLHYRYTFGDRRARRRPFVFVGTAGVFGWDRFPEQRILRADRSEVVYSSFARASLSGPQAIDAGAGVQQRLGAADLVAQGQALVAPGGGALLLGSLAVRFGMGERR
jgi:hypothetical protein